MINTRKNEESWRVFMSPEDIYWVEAIAQRLVATRNWDYVAAYNEALASVEQFYQEQLDMYGWVEREIEEVLHTKRVVYEQETTRINELAADQRRRDRQIRDARKAAAQQWKEWEERNIHVAVFECMFERAGGRSRWVHQQWLKGRTLASIGRNINRSRERVRQIINKEERLERWNRWHWFMARLRAAPPKGRPIDMGGPRDVWLTYYPSPDPRLDNMEPVNGESFLQPEGLQVHEHETTT